VVNSNFPNTQFTHQPAIEPKPSYENCIFISIMGGMDRPQTRARPALITIICLLACFGTVGTVRIVFFTPKGFNFGAWFPFYFFLHGALVLAASIGLWKMKKWGVYLYIFTIIEAQFVLMIIGIWGILSLVLFSGLLAVLLYYLPEME
jgi:hypothetical protein